MSRIILKDQTDAPKMHGRTNIVQELNLPPVKIHCSVLAEDAIKTALDDLQRKRSADTDSADGARTQPDSTQMP